MVVVFVFVYLVVVFVSLVLVVVVLLLYGGGGVVVCFWISGGGGGLCDTGWVGCPVQLDGHRGHKAPLSINKHNHLLCPSLYSNQPQHHYKGKVEKRNNLNRQRKNCGFCIFIERKTCLTFLSKQQKLKVLKKSTFK